MNRQPFYHSGEVVCNESKIPHDKKIEVEEAIKGIATVIKSSVELYQGVLMFTATSDVSEEANKKIGTISDVILEYEIDAEPGDPADLC